MRIDFSQVELATQSFIHALLSEVFRLCGQDAVELIEFAGCNPGVRAVVETVAQYSLHARKLAAVSLAGAVRSVDVPQADRLATLRAAVIAASEGKVFSREIAQDLGTSMRHAQYRLNAARILGFLEMYAGGIVFIRDSGESLAATAPDSEQERKHFVTAIRESEIVNSIAPRLLGASQPDPGEIARQIIDLTGLSLATAERRARVLLSWRRQVLADRQLSFWAAHHPR